ncbi:MAG: EAL domain-containing protein [Gallionellaceae bacterium]|nr:MAG: EAL domain-containing protein [Gallionellaceae bacterium]
MFKLSAEKKRIALNHKVAFLNSVFLLAGIVAFGMGFYRWQFSVVMGMIDFVFALCNFALIYHLNRHKEHIEAISSIALALSCLLFTAIYLLAPYNTTRLSLFFLLSASAFFLKGRRAGLNWLLFIILTVAIGHFLPGFNTAYMHIDIVTFSLYLIALYLILRNYDICNEQAAQYAAEEKILRLSEERFRTLVESGNDIIGVISDAGIVKFISPSAQPVLGFAPQEMIGKQVNELIHPDEHEKAAAALANALAHPNGEELEKYEFRMRHKDGSYRDIEMRGHNLISNPVIGGIVLNGRDVTSRKRDEIEIAQSRKALDAERQLFQAILDNSPLGIWMLGVDDKLRFVNKTFCNAVGVPEERFLAARHYVEVLPPAISESCIRSDRECFKQEHPHLSTEVIPFVDGKDHLLEITKTKLLDHDGKAIGLIGLAVDITERKRAEDWFRLTAKVFSNTLEGIIVTDVNCNIIEVNEAFTKINGYAREEVLGKNARLLQSGYQNRAFYENMWNSIVTTGHWTGEVWNRKKNGELYAEWLTISAISNEQGEVTHYVGISSDITMLKQHETQLERIAHYDALTGIPNRTLLNDRMQQAIARAARERNMMAVCYLDLDGFKPINDTMGHDAGDRVLIEIAQRLQHTVRGGDTVARLGGDEFVILLLGLERGEECNTTLERMLAIISEPIDIKGKPSVLSASIGVSIYPLDEEDTDTLLRHADQAMYMAKQSGKNRFHIYDPALDQRTRTQQELLKGIQSALQNGQFELYYQPKIDLRTQQLVGTEALIRWNHPEMGLIPPIKFLPAIKNTDLDIAIGEWVIASALRQLGLWRAAGLDIEVSINISAHHLESQGFVEKLQQQLAQHPGLPSNRFQIEVLETVALEDIAQVTRIIEDSKRIGVSFALDDFGTGYSSLSYLSSLPIDTLKIDQSFVRNLTVNEGDHAIVLGIIALSKAFDLQTVAEGIETEMHFRTLLGMGCDIGQGYGIARPMQAGALLAWAQENSAGNPLFPDRA